VVWVWAVILSVCRSCLPCLGTYLPILHVACGLGSRRVKGEYTKLRLIDASLLLVVLGLVFETRGLW
jgi:hypothetical protein